MTFKTFNPSTDTLEVGTKIRLGGLEWEIVDEDYPSRTHEIENSDYKTWVPLMDMAFEIADKPAEPLTIDKRVKENLLNMCDIEISHINIKRYLNSLEET